MCQLDVGGWRKEKGTRLTGLSCLHVLSCFVQLKSALLISCVSWIIFFRTLAVNSVSDLCIFFFIKNRLKVGEDEEEESNQSHGLKSDFLTRCDTICMISLCTSAISHYAALRKHFHYFHSDLLHSVSHFKKKDRKVFGCSPQIVRTCPLHFGRLKKLDCSDDISELKLRASGDRGVGE